MALTNWKVFSFFTASQVPVPADEDGAYIFDVSWFKHDIDGPADANPVERPDLYRRLC